ncbi:MAG: S24/S26 family peptidase [Alloprevotella sp.]
MREVNKEIPNKILIGEIRNALQQGHTATLRVKGVSMRPFLESLRDKVLLVPPQPEQIKVGDVVLAEISKDLFVLHRVAKREGERLTLRGDGNVYGTEKCTVSDVIGVVTAFFRKGKTTPDSVEDKKWRIYSRLWPSSSLLRRLILGIWRRVMV